MHARISGELGEGSVVARAGRGRRRGSGFSSGKFKANLTHPARALPIPLVALGGRGWFGLNRPPVGAPGERGLRRGRTGEELPGCTDAGNKTFLAKIFVKLRPHLFGRCNSREEH